MADKPLFWLSPQRPQTPPVGAKARQEMGVLLRLLQKGASVSAPHAKPLQTAGRGVRELRVRDGETGLTWRLAFRIDGDAIVVVHWWAKRTQRTAQKDIDLCKRRLAEFDQA